MSEQLKHRMQQWEATPPAGCWQAIAVGIADGHTPATARLFDAEIPPPPHSWTNITAVLDETARPKAPIKTIHRNLYRTAAVAALLIIMLGGSRWLSHRWSVSRFTSREQAATPGPAGAGSRPAVASAAQSNPGNDDNDTGDNFAGYRNPVRRPVTATTRLLKYTAVNIQPAYHEYPITVVHNSPADDAQTDRNNIKPLLVDNNYLVITGPNGEATRASHKIADALRYLYGDNGAEEAADKTNNENSRWKKRLQEWRSKIITSHFIPAPTNFLDIIDLKDLIDE
jgi:hypothetical protein